MNPRSWIRRAARAAAAFALTAVVCLPAAGGGTPGAAAATRPEKVRGIVLSTHTDGREWGRDVIGPTLDEIRSVGAGWVATHPYAMIRRDGTVRFRNFDPRNPPAYLVRPIREAHRRGLKILIKPHLAYWGSGFSWRGDITFEREDQWKRFFATYERWIVRLAKACRKADGFVVGTELDRTVGHEAEWRHVIAEVRKQTGSPLTYAANWSSYTKVPFWNAVDVIGIQAYFPLTATPDTDPAALDRGWRARMAEIRRFARSRDRKVVFTEFGCNRSLGAAHRPWDPRVDGPEAERFQEVCLRAALRAVESEPSVVGLFLWKWFPEPYPVGRNFQLATPRLRRVIQKAWDGSAR